MRDENALYDRKWLIWCTLGLVAMAAAMKLSGGVAFALIFPLILVAFSKNRPELMFYCLLMTIAITMSNPHVVPKGFSFGIMARVVHLLIAGVMVLQMVGQRSSRQVSPLIAILFYLVYMAIVSAVGWRPIISYLKLLLFTVIFMGFYSVANVSAVRQGADSRRLRSAMLAFAIYFLVGSVALIPFPAIGIMSAADFVEQFGYLPEGGLFMGITLHSQALGPVVATLGAILFGDMLFNLRSWNKLYVFLLLLVPLLIYKTGSRTAMGTLLAGWFFLGFLLMQANGARIGARWKQRALSALTLLGLVVGISLFATPGMREAVGRFVVKYSDQEEALDLSWDSVTASRQASFENQVAGFQSSPWVGNGFQVASYHKDMYIVSWMQLLSAPVEKGTWVIAVLEEGGILGMALFVICFLFIIGALWSRRAYVGLSLVVVLLVANLGEFTIFSMTSVGGVAWAMVFVALTLDTHRQRAPYPIWNVSSPYPVDTPLPYSVGAGRV